MCRPLVGEKSIQLAESYPTEPVLVLGDEDRLQQVLFNLVSNAIKFTQRGWVTVSIEVMDINARIAVGLSISQKLIELHGTEIILRSSAGEGSTFYFDLLLLTTKNNVSAGNNYCLKKTAQEDDQLQELLTQTPKPFMDRRSDTAGIPLSAPTALMHENKRRTILVIDDEYLNVHIVKEHLSSMYDISSASSGQEALSLLEAPRIRNAKNDECKYF